MKSKKKEQIPIEAVIAQLRDGPRREESFRLLFDRFYWPLFHFFGERKFPAEECKDLVQETFLRAYRGLGTFRGDARWDHWLFRIAANTAVKAFRQGTAAKRTGRTVPWESDGAESQPLLTPADRSRGGEAAPLRRLLDQERKQLLSRAIDGLPTQMRRCMRLRVYQEMSYEEIADLLQIAPGTVKVHLFKARERLQMELRDSFTDFDL